MGMFYQVLYLEQLGSLRIVFVDVWMVFLGQSVVSLLNVLGRGVPRDAQDLVVVLLPRLTGVEGSGGPRTRRQRQSKE